MAYLRSHGTPVAINPFGDVTLTGTQTLTNKTLTTPDIGTPSAGVVTNLSGTLPAAMGFPLGLGGGAGGHVLSIKTAEYNTQKTVSTNDWSTALSAITHTMTNSNNVLYFMSMITIFTGSPSYTRGQIGVSKDTTGTDNVIYSGGIRQWQLDSTQTGSNNSVACNNFFWYAPGDTSSHVYSQHINPSSGSITACYNHEAKSVLVMMEMTGD